MTAIVEVDSLAKTYKGGFTALRGVSLSIAEGEILALLGPNGAGKTTLISALCGLTTPTGGRARIDGHDLIAFIAPRAALSGWCRRKWRSSPSRRSSTLCASRAASSARAATSR